MPLATSTLGSRGPDPARPERCRQCGISAAADPTAGLTWARQHGGDDRGGDPATATWLCPGCTRAHLRAIEARLDREGW